MQGLELRLRRLVRPGGPALFSVPLDHALSMGPIDGLEDLRSTSRELVEAGVDCLIVPPGGARVIASELAPTTRLGVHISASTSLGPDPDWKRPSASVRQAVALGADLLSVQVNFGSPHEPEMMAELAHTVEEAHQLGVPVLCMTYVKGSRAADAAAHRHAARAAAELGADIVKAADPGGKGELRKLVASTPVPVVLGGGPPSDSPEATIDRIREALEEGVAGICFGRRLFQRTPLLPFAKQVAELLHRTRLGPA